MKMEGNRTIWIVGIALLVLVLVWWKKDKNRNINQYKVAVELLQQQNDSLANDNRLLDEKMKQIQWRTDSLQQLVATKSDVIKNLKKAKDEKIKAINTYSNHKLYSFFAELDTDSTAVK